MKNTLHTLLVVSAFAVTTTGFAQTKSSPPANYKQQNMHLAKKDKVVKPTEIALSNDYSSNPLANHRNYKAHVNAPKANTIAFEVALGNRHRNYKQKNLLTSNGYKEANKDEEGIQKEELVLK